MIKIKKSITKNYIYNLVYQILIIILPLITTPYISRVLGAENIGIYSFTISVATYFILFGSLGVATYGQREIAYLQDDKKKYSKTFWEIVVFRFMTLLISMVIFYIVFVNGNNDYRIYYGILLLEILANCFDISWFFQGLEEFKKTVVRNIIVKLISIACIFAFVKTADDLGIYMWIYVLSTLIGNISLWWYLPKYINKEKFKNLNILRHLKPTIGLFIPQVAVQIYTVLDKVMIGAIIPDKTITGYYEQAQKIIKLLLTIITSLGTVMIPRIANIFVTGDKETIHKHLDNSFRFVYTFAFPMIFGLMLVANNFVPSFFGQGYDQVAILICIISPILLMIGLSNVIGTQYLLPTKRQREFTISVTVGAVVNLLLNFILIKNYGAIGASISTVIAETVVTLIQFIYVRKDLDIRRILNASFKYIVAAAVMFLVCYPIGFIVSGNLQNVIAKGIVGVIVYFGALIFMKDEFVFFIINKVTGRFKKTL